MIIYKIAPSGNSKLAGRKYDEYCQVLVTKTLSRGFVLSQEYFPSSYVFVDVSDDTGSLALLIGSDV